MTNRHEATTFDASALSTTGTTIRSLHVLRSELFKLLNLNLNLGAVASFQVSRRQGWAEVEDRARCRERQGDVLDG